MHHSPLGNTGANEGGSLALGMEHGWNRLAAALPHDDNDLTLAILIASETAVDAIFLQIGGLDIPSKISPIDLGLFAFTADNATAHFLSHRFAQFVEQHECRLVG